MNTIKYLGFAGLAAAGLFATQAFATTCPTGTQGTHVCVATSGGGGEPSLLRPAKRYRNGNCRPV